MSLAEIVAVGSLVWLAIALAQAGVGSFRSRLVDLDGQLLGLVLGIAAMAAYVGLLGLEVKLTSLALAAIAGVAFGYGVALLAGFEDVAGLAVMRGSGWFLVTWGISALGAIAGALAQEQNLLAASLLAGAASLGAQLGQFVAGWRSVLRIERGAPGQPEGDPA